MDSVASDGFTNLQNFLDSEKNVFTEIEMLITLAQNFSNFELSPSLVPVVDQLISTTEWLQDSGTKNKELLEVKSIF
jgi:hypothetical protein